MRDFRDAKIMAKSLRQRLTERGLTISHSEALELVAEQFGFDDWNILAAKLAAAETLAPAAIPLSAPLIAPPIPIFRIFDVTKAREFYCDYLGMTVDWEHRFGENFPLYFQVSRGALILHLSEHSGDASPGARIFVWVTDVVAIHREITARDYRFLKPGLQDAPWGRELHLTDPFSNRITLCEKAELAPGGK
ncbi:glyoxalase superfamily protein [Rhizobium sp. 18065]|uniref:glyoxalase superfamily protein n=1 Tax=Rhizobium sp. 18065 TaxID=2681411 RepID=UPI00135A4794|nr:glyoxalase superfamily protein [Rhizobium sp. 18065]